jgi:hypothetical protein
MENYGPFADVVTNAGTIMAMGAAIALAWRGRSQWEPAEDDVPKAPQKVAGLLSAIIIAGIWATLQRPEDAPTLLRLSIGLSIVSFACLCLYAFLVSTQTYEQVISKGVKTFDRRNIIGGFTLSEQSKRIIEEHRNSGKSPPTTSELFKAAAYNADRVWTRPSRALAKVFCIACYVGLITTGTVALASAAILIGIRLSSQTAVNST